MFHPPIPQNEVPRHDQNLTYAIFDPADRKVAGDLATRLRARRHVVSIHDGDHFDPVRLPLRGVSAWRGIVVGMAAAVALTTAFLAATHSLGALNVQPLESSSVGVVLALALALGGLVGLIVGAHVAKPELQDAEDDLSPNGRFALTVSTPRDERHEVEAQLQAAGALTVGSI